MEVKGESEVAQSCLTLRDPMDCSLPDSSVHGIFQARVLEWGAITFSEIYIRYTFFLARPYKALLKDIEDNTNNWRNLIPPFLDIPG